MTNIVTTADLKATHITATTDAWVKRVAGDFIVRSSFKGYEVLTAGTKQRIGNFSDIKSVKKFLTKF